MKMQKGLIGASVWLALALWLGVANLAAQTNSRLKMDWERFAAQASERTEVTLDGGLLRSVARFLNDDDKDAKDVQKLLAGLQGVYIHSYGFKHEHQYAEADLDSIRKQLKDANWGRIVQSVNHDGGERDEIYLKNTTREGDSNGLVVLVAEPHEFTLVEIAGKIDPKDLGRLDGALHFRHSGRADKDDADEN